MQPKLIAPSVEHKPFIYNSMLKSLRNHPPYTWMANDTYFPFMSNMIDMLLASSNALLAVDPLDESSMFGYILYSNPQRVHFVYTKYPFRKLGIASLLLKEINNSRGEPTYCSFFTHQVSKASVKYNLTYQPIKDIT